MANKKLYSLMALDYKKIKKLFTFTKIRKKTLMRFR